MNNTTQEKYSLAGRRVFVAGHKGMVGSALIRSLKNIDCEILITDTKIAELIKYVNNTFHALKVSFANEIGNICKELNIDSHKVMEVVCADKKLNLSPQVFQQKS